MLGIPGISCALAGSVTVRQAKRAKRKITVGGMAARLAKFKPLGNLNFLLARTPARFLREAEDEPGADVDQRHWPNVRRLVEFRAVHGSHRAVTDLKRAKINVLAEPVVGSGAQAELHVRLVYGAQ